jgi:hypothetical protein
MDHSPGKHQEQPYARNKARRVSYEGEIRVEHHRISTEHNAFPGIPLRRETGTGMICWHEIIRLFFMATAREYPWIGGSRMSATEEGRGQ